MKANVLLGALLLYSVGLSFLVVPTTAKIKETESILKGLQEQLEVYNYRTCKTPLQGVNGWFCSEWQKT